VIVAGGQKVQPGGLVQVAESHIAPAPAASSAQPPAAPIAPSDTRPAATRAVFRQSK
jgi:hypothetical protein